jgi:N-acetylmuramic acid 6-phosphate (MurNAc-6-P) etherase
MDAVAALAQAQGKVKPAVLILRGAENLATAEQLLAAAQGNLRLALANLKSRV